MKRQILLPTDFSDNAWSAIDYAVKFFKDEQCTFWLLNSIALNISAMSNFSNRLQTVMKNKAQEDLNALKAEIEMSNSNPNHEFIAVVSALDLFHAIEIEAKKHRIEFIVMGTKGATGAKEMFFGSNTVKVIKKVKDCPLIIVPHEYDFSVPKQVAFPTDFKINLSKAQLQPLIVLSNIHHSKIRILHINEEEELGAEQEHNLQTLEMHLKELDCSYHWMPEYSTKENEIQEFIEDLGIDMLAMVSHQKSWIERLANKPVIKKIGFQPFVPFMVIPA